MPNLRWPKITWLSKTACDPPLSENCALYDVEIACKKIQPPNQPEILKIWSYWGQGGGLRAVSCLPCPPELQVGWRITACGIYHTRSCRIQAKSNFLLQNATHKLNLFQARYDRNKVGMVSTTSARCLVKWDMLPPTRARRMGQALSN